MKTQPVALTDLVKSLGYENSAPLSNKIRDILKNKEDFKRKYIIDEEVLSGGRPEKTLVSPDAKILVDNIAIIQQYSTTLFGKASPDDSSVLPYYRELKQGIDEEWFKIKVCQQKTKLHTSLTRSKDSLEALPTFAKTILDNPKIDIRNTSIRSLMESSEGSANLINFGKVYELAAWNELVNLQDKVTEGENTSLNHQLIGDRLLSLGDIDQALIALNESVELNPENGVAWALIAHITYQMLMKKYQEHSTALARTDYSGFIENPITSEEHWINERVEETYEDVDISRKRFAEAAIQALQFWPSWNGIPTKLDDGSTKPNYYYTLDQCGYTSVELKRDNLFLLLLDHITRQDFLQYREECVEIWRSFQRWNAELYPLTSIFSFPLNSYGSLIQFISWIDKDELSVAIEELVKEFGRNIHSARKTIEFLQQPNVSQMFWIHLGRDRYAKLLVSLEESEREHTENSRVEVLSTLQVRDILLCFKNLNELLKQESLQRWKLILGNIDLEEEPRWSQDAIEMFEESCQRALPYLEGWKSLVDSVLSNKCVYGQRRGHVLIFLSSVIEICNDIHIAENVKILKTFAFDKYSFSCVRDSVDERLVSMFFDWISNSPRFEGTQLHDTVQELIDLDYELAMEDEADY
ncbi:hypothetical protein VroAM7_33380 [Vibrio rotiferianus]|uniref:Uncharacterized protein n=1 Tax=Vibrio rotiferianus TaxID=190895 RepID=A0A510IA84_9VIBR|nr:hypothetical protein [Vibrio rotiferianus]BBL90685.1 hypothetical protein VroAM7_33380 [Vibrio rotiferianus]